MVIWCIEIDVIILIFDKGWMIMIISIKNLSKICDMLKFLIGYIVYIFDFSYLIRYEAIYSLTQVV